MNPYDAPAAEDAAPAPGPTPAERPGLKIQGKRLLRFMLLAVVLFAGALALLLYLLPS